MHVDGNVITLVEVYWPQIELRRNLIFAVIPTRVSMFEYFASDKIVHSVKPKTTLTVSIKKMQSIGPFSVHPSRISCDKNYHMHNNNTA